MTSVCVLTGKKKMSGNNVSHANNKTCRYFKPNFQFKKIWIPSIGRFVKFKLTAKAIKWIDKIGADNYYSIIRRKNDA